MMASLGYAAGGKALADEHFGELVRAIIDDQHEVIWSGAWPSCSRVQLPMPDGQDLSYWT